MNRPSPPRIELPNRRAGPTEEIEACGGARALCTVNLFEEGPMEIFLEVTDKAGSPRAYELHDAAALVSLALRHGIPPNRLRRSMAKDEQGRPASVIGSAVDMVVRCLEEMNRGAEAAVAVRL